MRRSHLILETTKTRSRTSWLPTVHLTLTLSAAEVSGPLVLKNPSRSVLALRAVAQSAGQTLRVSATGPESASLPEPDGRSLLLVGPGKTTLTIEDPLDAPATLLIAPSRELGESARDLLDDRCAAAERARTLARRLLALNGESERLQAAQRHTNDPSSTLPDPLRPLREVRLDGRPLRPTELHTLLARATVEPSPPYTSIAVVTLGQAQTAAATVDSLRVTDPGPWRLLASEHEPTLVATDTGVPSRMLADTAADDALSDIDHVLFLPAGATLLPGWREELARASADLTLLGGIEVRQDVGDVVLYGELDPVLLFSTPAFGLGVAVRRDALPAEVPLPHGIEGIWGLVAELVQQGCTAAGTDALVLVTPPWPRNADEATALPDRLAGLVNAELVGTSQTEHSQWPPIVLHHRLRPPSWASVSVIIPTHDAPQHLEAALRSVREADYPGPVELILVAHRVRNPDVEHLLADAMTWGASVVRDDGAFNFSRLINRGAEHATGELLLFMNDDIAPTGTDWLRELVSAHVAHGARVTGARLLSADGTRIQHLGQVRSALGTLQHLHVGRPAEDLGYCGRGAATASVTSVTGALMLVDAARFRAVGGFDERYDVAFGDTDLVLRLRANGGRAIVCTSATALHPELTTRGSDARPARHLGFASESMAFRREHGWQLATDRCLAPRLRARDDTLEVVPATGRHECNLVAVQLGPEDAGGGFDVVLLDSETAQITLEMPSDLPTTEIVGIELRLTLLGGDPQALTATLDGTPLSWHPRAGHLADLRCDEGVPTAGRQVHHLDLVPGAELASLRVVPAPTAQVTAPTTRGLELACAATAWVRLPRQQVPMSQPHV
ncbi:glycosyltransferase [Acidimicrobium ferrooxidans]|nr:glycosyltransferase [Acidimicrobium ferrooxidans]